MDESGLDQEVIGTTMEFVVTSFRIRNSSCGFKPIRNKE